MKYLAVILLSVATASVSAQGWSIPGNSAQIQFADIVYLESIYHIPHSAKTDTLPGTGFLITTADSSVFVVTTKRQLQAALQNTAKVLLQMGGGPYPKRKMIPIKLISGNGHRSLYAFSGDGDLAIISLSNNQNKQALNTLTKLECKPVSVDSIDIADHAPGESFFLTSYNCFLNNWARSISAGLSPGTIKKYSNKSPTYLIDHPSWVSYAGAPIFKDNQIIGMVTHPTGLNTINNFLKNPYQEHESAVVIKAKYILPLLKKLQHQQLNHSLSYPEQNIPKISPLQIKSAN